MSSRFRISLAQVPPLVAWCLCFCLGIIAGRVVRLPWLFVAAVAVGLLTASAIIIKKAIPSTILIFTLAFLLGMLNLYRAQMVPGCSVARVLAKGKQTVALQGQVASDPVFNGHQGHLFLDVNQISRGNGHCPVCGHVLVRFRSQPDVRQGDQVLARGVLHRPYGGFWLDQVDAVMSTKGKNAFVVLPHKTNFLSLIFSCKQKLKDAMGRTVAPAERNLLGAMLFGDREGVPRSVKDSMIRAGTWHIMVVSGTHTTLVAVILLIFLKVVRLPRKIRFWLSIVLLVGYCLLTGASNPVVRATVMSVVFLAGFLVERKPHFYNSLAAAALAILCFDPTQLFDIGFQLSFFSVFFIVWLSPKIKALFPERLVGNRFLAYSVTGFCISLSAWLGTAPLMAHAFGSLSWLTVLANIIVVPLAMLVMMAGFCLVFTAIVLPFMAPSIGLATGLLVYALVKINFIFSGIPFSYWKFRPVPLAVVLAIYAAMFLLVNSLCKKNETNQPD